MEDRWRTRRGWIENKNMGDGGREENGQTQGMDEGWMEGWMDGEEIEERWRTDMEDGGRNGGWIEGGRAMGGGWMDDRWRDGRMDIVMEGWMEG